MLSLDRHAPKTPKKHLWEAVFLVFLATLSLMSVRPPTASALYDAPQCSFALTRGFKTHFRTSDSADPSGGADDLYNYITQGYPTIIYSDNKNAEVPNIKILVINDNGETGKAVLHPVGYSSPEYLLRVTGASGTATGANLQVDDGEPIFWDWAEDDTAPYGSYFSPTLTSWSTSITQNRFPDTDDNFCVVAIGGRISVPSGYDIPWTTINEIDENLPPVDHGWNVVDWLKEFWGFIVGLPDFIADLFIPETSTITAITSDFTDFFTEKFGFLVWPFEFISDLLDLLMGTGSSSEFDDFGNPYNWCSTSEWGVGSSVSAWSFGNFLSSPMTMNPCMFQKIMPTVWFFATLVARGLLVYAVVNFLLNAHRRHVK